MRAAHVGLFQHRIFLFKERCVGACVNDEIDVFERRMARKFSFELVVRQVSGNSQDPVRIVCISVQRKNTRQTLSRFGVTSCTNQANNFIGTFGL